MKIKYYTVLLMILSMFLHVAYAQEQLKKGLITDSNGPLPGVNVKVKGTKTAVQSDLNGNYQIQAKNGDVLVFSLVGMTTKEWKITSGSVVNMKLEPVPYNMSEIIIEGYRSTTKASATIAQASVNAKTIENRPNATFVQTLQGQLAGVNISTGSGQPGAKSSVVIRGNGSINANSDPLYVIDGMPSNADNFRSINPNDIESVTVLKDAAATSVYGNRGSNGIIVIKTKRVGFGAESTRFKYSSSSGFTILQDAKYNRSNSKELLTLEKRRNVGVGATLTDLQIANWTDETNWVKFFFKTGISTEHQLSMEKQSKLLGNYTSMSYLNQQGVLTTTRLNRFTLRNNINGKSANGKFTYDNTISLGFSKNDEAPSLGTASVNRNYVAGAYISAPHLSPTLYKGSEDLLALYNRTPTLLYTPLLLMDQLKKYGGTTQEMRLIISTDIGYDITPWLKAKIRTSGELLETRFNQYAHPISWNELIFKNPAAEFGGFEDINNGREFYFNQLWQLDFHKKIEKNNFSLLLNSEYNFNILNANNIRQLGLDPKTFVPNSGAGYLADIAAHDFYGLRGSASQLKNNLISYFALADYDFDQKFGLSGSIRYDGSSRFASEKQWGTFWAISGRVNLSNFDFLKPITWVTNLKLRASYGTTGNQRIFAGTVFAGILPPAFTDTYRNAPNIYNGQAAYAVNFGYPDLRWETTLQANVGVDFELFKGRLRGTSDIFEKTTKDLFFREPVSVISGTTSLLKNSEVNVINKGVELSLAYDLLQTSSWKITFRGNGTYIKNSVKNIIANDGRFINGNLITSNGNAVNEFYLLNYAGVNPATGNLWFRKKDGTLSESPSLDTDRMNTKKRSTPVYQGGFGLDAEWKQFYFSTTATYAQKVWRIDADASFLYNSNNIGQFVVSRDLLKAWTPANTNTNIPALNANNMGLSQNSDRFLIDASYVRIRNIQLGYRFSKENLKTFGLTKLTIYTQAENLATFTKWKGLDAESDRNLDQNNYPTPKIVTFGMEIQF